MIKLLKYYLFFLFITISFFSFGQPQSPKFYKVTVNPYDGYDTVIWYSSKNAQYYRINIVVYNNPLNPYTNDSIGVVYSPDTVFVNKYDQFFVNYYSQFGIKPIGYSVAAVASLRSTFNVPDSTIHLSVSFDSCSKRISLRWNDYNTWRGNIKEYRILRVNNSRNPAQVAVVNSDRRIIDYSMDLTYENNLDSFFVEAIHNDGRVSASNMSGILVNIPRSPGFITANSAESSEDGKIIVSFMVDPVSQLRKYRILRSQSVTGEFEQVEDIETNEKIIRFSDTEVDYLSGIYYYKIQSLDLCGNIVAESNSINNIILTGSNSGILNSLSWNNIPDWTGETESYTVFRQNMDYPSLTDSFIISGINFEDNLQGYFNSVNTQSGKFCYRLKANEINNPFGNSTAYSNTICLNIIPDIILPNAFIPDNPDGVNNIFKPLFVFEPLEYELTIYNRWGNKIWTGNTGWDGRQNGKLVSEGVYAYHIIVIFKDEKQEKTGYVTVIYR